MPVYDAAGFQDLRDIVAQDEVIGFIVESLPDSLPGWVVLDVSPLPQMVCRQLRPAPKVDAIELTMDDVPDMLELVALAQPGPFLPRTIILGRYLGIREEGRLVAMAGQRLHLPGYCEVSAVCTHPGYRGRGYGGALTTMVAQDILARGETPFLHHAPTNEGAARLYRKLGFRKRRELSVAVLQKSATG